MKPEFLGADLWATVPQAFKKKRDWLWLAAVACLAAFVWPTPFRYDHVGGGYLRINRITGNAQILHGLRWRPVQLSEFLAAQRSREQAALWERAMTEDGPLVTDTIRKATKIDSAALPRAESVLGHH